LDGIDIRKLDPTWLRKQIGVVTQEPHLFACSIADNIAYGCTAATREQIIEAAKHANCHDFITQFADGYDTLVGMPRRLSPSSNALVSANSAVTSRYSLGCVACA
jgi:ABC-type multidrug transport system fused ATPase/permease subunit